MKISNVEKFRKELFDNMEDLYFSDCSIKTPAKVEFQNSAKKHLEVCKLENPLMIEKKEYPSMKVVKTLYITVEDDSVMIWKPVPGEDLGFYKFICAEYFKDYKNKTSFSMNLAMTVEKLMNR